MRRWLVVAMLFLAGAAHAASPQIAFFNHSFAVVDARTADAIAHSDYLRAFGVFELRTTVADGGATWTGRYLSGRQTYLELFGPKDVQDPGTVEGSTGLAVSPDHAGGLGALTARLIAGGIAKPDVGLRIRKIGKALLPWFDYVSPPGDPKSLSVWAMAYRQSFFDDPRTAKEPPDFPGDLSRERYQSDAWRQRLMRDVSTIEIAATSEDVASARVLLAAAGFHVRQTGSRLTARDQDMTIVLDAVPLAQIGVRRIGFALNKSSGRVHVETIGRSILTVGPGWSALWVFTPRS